MKKIIGLLLICTFVLLSLPVFAAGDFTAPKIIKGSLETKMEKLFVNLGLDIDRDFYLLMEVYGLVDYRKTKLGWSRLYKTLKQYDTEGKQVNVRFPHKSCMPGKKGFELDFDFYGALGSVIPSQNKIISYKLPLLYPDKVFTVGSGDIDTESDNCEGVTLGKDDKPAGCVRRMWHYFATTEFELVSCK